MAGSLLLCGDGVSEAVLTKAAHGTGYRVLPCPTDAEMAVDEQELEGQALVVLVGEVDEDRLVRALRPPVRACVEPEGPLEPLLAAVPEQGLLLSLTTATAYGIEVARAFCDAVSARADMDEKLRQVMELALHEALVNAMVHGNLEIHSVSKDSLDDFIHFCQLVETRLADVGFGSRRIDLHASWTDADITIVVQDCGPGYDADAVLARPVDLNKKSGRGLFLIKDICRSIAIEDGGRRLLMSFAR